MTQEQLILFKRSLNIYNTETEAWTALDNLTHIQGQPVVAFFRRTSNTHGDTALGAIFAIGTDNGVGKYKACSSHDDMLAVAQALNTHISEWTAFKDTFDKMFEYDANHNAIKAKLDFYTDSNKNISAGGLGGSGASSLGALYQLVDVMINSTGDGVEGAVEGSVLAYDATAGKWKAIAQSEILPNMSNYYTKEETDAAINAIPIYSMAKLSASDIANLSDGTNVREAYRLKKGGSNVDDTVIKIYKDSAIKSLELRDNKYLVLTYIDNEGNEQSISKDLSVIVNDNYVDLINNQDIGGIKTFTEKTIFKKDINVLGDAVVGGEVAAIVSDGTPTGETDYSALTGKPSINGKELASGNNTLDELGIQPKGDYTTASQLASTLEDYATKAFVSNNYASKAAVNTIQALIPATASATNQLADKDFVNSSIATATAEFRGSFTSLDELKATSGNLNDYAFYLHTDNIGNKVVDRYKWTTAGWIYEYTLNNSSFTAEQWAALNSAITATLVQSYNNHLKNSTTHITSDERTKWNNKWDYNEATIKAVKVNAAVSADKLATANEGTSAIPIYFKNGKPAQCIPSDLFSVFDNAYSSTGERSLGITIAGHTRMVVVAYSTLAGSADKLATARKIWGRPFDGSADVSGDLEDVRNISASGKATIQGDIVCGGEVVAITGEGTPAGVTDYSALTGKPQINGVTLVSGNNTLASLGIQAAGDYATNSGVTTLLADYATKVFVSNNYAGKSAFNSHIADTNIHITSAERAAWNAKWDYNEATIKAVKVTSASSADSVAWAGISGKPTTFTPSAHTHTASDVSGLPTSLKNPYALTFGSKTYDGSAAATITASDLGALTSITKSMVEGVLTGDITSHTHTFASLTSKPTTIAGYGITDAYTATTIDNKLSGYLPLTGGTISNQLSIDYNSIYPLVLNGSENYSVIRFRARGTEASDMGWLNDYRGNLSYISNISNSGVISVNYDGVYYSDELTNFKKYTIIHTGNYNSYSPKLDGTGASGTWAINISGNAAKVGGFSVTSGNSKPWGTIPAITKSGYMDVGKHFEFHYDNTTGSDYSTVLGCTGNYGNIVSLPSASGTLALLTDNVASATKLQTPRTIWGQSFDGTGNVSGNLNVGASKLYWNEDTEGSFISSIGMTHMTYEMRGGHNFCVGGDEILRIRKYGDYNLEVIGTGHYSGDLIVDGEVSALVA